MTFNICNTEAWGELSEKYYETLRPFSLKISEGNRATVELNILQDIIDLKEKVNEEIIISNYLRGEDPTIEIYDTWRE